MVPVSELRFHQYPSVTVMDRLTNLGFPVGLSGIPLLKTRHFSKDDPSRDVVAFACQNTCKRPKCPNQVKKGQENV